MSALYSALVLACAGVGWVITGRVGGVVSRAERWGLSLWLGYLVLSFLMWITHLGGLPLRPVVYAPPMILVAAWGALRMRRSDPGADPGAPRGSTAPRRWAVKGPLIVLSLLLIALILTRCAFLPNRVYDSITSFDLLAKAISVEDQFRVSLFDHTGVARGGSYPPFLPLTLAWGYDASIATAPQALVVPLVAFFVWLIGFAHRLFGSVTAWFVVAAALVSPNLNAYVQLPLANMPVIVFGAMAFGYLFAAVTESDSRLLAYTSVACAGCAWTRADAMAVWFGIAVAVFVAVSTVSWRRRLLTVAPALVVTGAWQLYVERVLGTGAGDRLFTAGLTDATRLSTLVHDGVFVLFSTSTGLAPWLFVVGGAIALFRGPRGARTLAIAILVSVFVYTLGFVFLDPVKQDPLAGLLRSTYKRGLTVFVIPMFCVFAASPVGTWLRRSVGRKFD